MSLKNPEFIRDSIKHIKKYGYRIKNRSYLRFCPAKSGFLDVKNEKCYFLTQEKTAITNFSVKINYTDVKRIRRRKYQRFQNFQKPSLGSRKSLVHDQNEMTPCSRPENDSSLLFQFRSRGRMKKLSTRFEVSASNFCIVDSLKSNPNLIRGRSQNT